MAGLPAVGELSHLFQLWKFLSDCLDKVNTIN
jgi:hypothetical protein